MPVCSPFFRPSPTGGSGEVETDVAQEFNPANRSGHPIVATLNSYTGNVAPKALTTSQLGSGWQANPGDQTMFCSDCHGDEAALPARRLDAAATMAAAAGE